LLLGVASPFVDISTLFPKGRQYLGPHFPFNERSRTTQRETPWLPDVVDPHNIRRQHFLMLRWVLLCDYCSCFCRRPLNLVGPPLPTSLSWFTSATITTGSEYVPLQTCLLPLAFRPRGCCSHLHQQFRHFLFRVTSHEHGACPPRLYTLVYCFHTL
jgi:hypothetical protein